MQGEALAKYLCGRYEEMVRVRSPYEDIWQKISDSMLGMRDFKSSPKDSIPRRKDIDLYDSTALNMWTNLSAALHSLISNPDTEFFNLRFVDNALNESQNAQEWLAACERHLYTIFQSSRTRFKQQMHEVYRDLIGFGTGCLFVDVDREDGTILFSARPLSELYIADDNSGRIDTVMRRYAFTHRQAVQEWGDRAPDRAKQAVEKGRGVEERSEYVHVVIQASEIGKESQKPYAAFDLDIETKKLLSDGGYYELPYIVGRWEKDAGDIYARSPSWNALADSRMLNEMNKAIIQAAQLNARPPLLYDDDGVMIPSVLRPGAKLAVRGGGFLNPPASFMAVNANTNIAAELVRDKRNQVEEAYFNSLVKAAREPYITATQTNQISEAIQRNLAPIVGRIQTELVAPAIERVFNIEVREGRMPSPPRDVSGNAMRVEFVSTLARSQRMSDVQALGDMISFAMNIAQADKDVLKTINLDESVRFIASAQGVPPQVINSREDVEEMKQAEREVIAQQQAMAMAQQAAETAATAGAGQPTA